MAASRPLLGRGAAVRLIGNYDVEQENLHAGVRKVGGDACPHGPRSQYGNASDECHGHRLSYRDAACKCAAVCKET